MFRSRIAKICGLLLTLSSATTLWASAREPQSLYDRLGGNANLTAVVDELIDRAASDPRLKRSFAKVNLRHLKGMLVEQICDLTGGPCQYSGDSMRDAHAGLGITQAEMYGLVQLLKNSMLHHGIAIRERNELLAILAPMKRDVVER